MSTAGLLAGVVIAVLSLFALVQPFFKGRTEEAATLTAQKEHDALLTAYERVLSIIRDLDEDYNVGKLTQSTYTTERARYAEQGVALLQALEKTTERFGGKRAKALSKRSPKPQVAPQPVNSVQAEQALDDALEQVIAQYAQSSSEHKGASR